MRAIIIDDEPNCCKTLAALLDRFAPEVKVVSICKNGKEGMESIKQEKPDLVFLDVEMPIMNGFEMLERLEAIDFHLVFTTSYDQYALKAFRFSAVDYLLKPIDKTELLQSIEKAKRVDKTVTQQIELLLEKIHHPLAAINKIAVPTMEGLQMISIENIISAEADDNYSILKLKGNKKVVVSTTLKEVEEALENHPFSRVHRCYLVNLNEIEKYVKGEGGYLVMSDGSIIDVSRSKKEPLLKKLLPNRE
jgi:two-component system, LytTR family, response regulator